MHGWLEDVGNLRKGHAALGPFESRDHALTRNSAGDEHHPPLVTREHPATCCGLLDIEREQRHDRVYESVERDYGQPAALAYQAIHRCELCVRKGCARQAVFERCQFLLRFGAKLCERGRIGLSFHCAE